MAQSELASGKVFGALRFRNMYSPVIEKAGILVFDASNSFRKRRIREGFLAQASESWKGIPCI